MKPSVLVMTLTAGLMTASAFAQTPPPNPSTAPTTPKTDTQGSDSKEPAKAEMPKGSDSKEPAKAETPKSSYQGSDSKETPPKKSSTAGTDATK